MIVLCIGVKQLLARELQLDSTSSLKTVGTIPVLTQACRAMLYFKPFDMHKAKTYRQHDITNDSTVQHKHSKC